MMNLAALESVCNIAALRESILAPQGSCIQVRFPRLHVREIECTLVERKSFIISELGAAVIISPIIYSLPFKACA